MTWSLNPNVGTISTSGLYTAPTTIASQQTVTVTATSVADNTKSATATITLSPAPGVSVAPPAVTLYPNQTQRFTATVVNTTNTAVAWSLTPNVGTLSSSGLYTAPSSIASAQTVTVIATSAVDNTTSASATVTLSPPVTVTVSGSKHFALIANDTEQFTASVTNASNTAVTWSLSPNVGTISSSGLYTAPTPIASDQTITVIATSAADSTKSGSATALLTAAIGIVFGQVPQIYLYANQAVQYTVTVTNTSNTAVTWSISPMLGTISSSGLYTAPSSINPSGQNVDSHRNKLGGRHHVRLADRYLGTTDNC